MNKLIGHDWQEEGVDMHRGEYWFTCTKCGASDWIASYGNKSQLMPKNCTPTKQIKTAK